MRVPPSVLLGILCLSASALSAQDLEYRLIMRAASTQPGAQPQAVESAMYIKGSRIRADSHASGSSNSIIVDAAQGKLYPIDHAAHTYQEIPTDFAADTMLMKGDTARLRALGLIPQVTRTGETRTMLGFPAVRIVSVQKQPFPGEPDAQLVMISDSWVSQDPQLMRAFNASMEAARKLMGGAAQSVMSLLPAEANGLPLATTTLMLKATGNASVDAMAVLRNPHPAGLLMRSEMEATEVKLLSLPDSLFRLPATYRKVN